MCLATPGKIKSINKDNARIDFGGIERQVNISLLKCKRGDFVLVHAGFAIEKIDEKEAKKIKELFRKQIKR